MANGLGCERVSWWQRGAQKAKEENECLPSRQVKKQRRTGKERNEAIHR